MGATLSAAIPGWSFGASEDFAARVATGHARESARLRGHAHVLALVLSEFDQDGLSERVELLQPVPDLEEGAVRAEAECRVRAELLRAERGWQEQSVGGARALAPFADAPFLAVRRIGDGDKINTAYVRVAVLPLGSGAPLGIEFVRAVGLDRELANWFASRGP
jgi:hypothetical protein